MIFSMTIMVLVMSGYGAMRMIELFFFFQGGDGIPSVERSRWVGEGYKGQIL